MNIGDLSNSAGSGKMSAELSNKTVAQLKEFAKENGIALPSRAKKQRIIEIIMEELYDIEPENKYDTGDLPEEPVLESASEIVADTEIEESVGNGGTAVDYPEREPETPESGIEQDHDLASAEEPMPTVDENSTPEDIVAAAAAGLGVSVVSNESTAYAVELEPVDIEEPAQSIVDNIVYPADDGIDQSTQAYAPIAYTPVPANEYTDGIDPSDIPFADVAPEEPPMDERARAAASLYDDDRPAESEDVATVAAVATAAAAAAATEQEETDDVEAARARLNARRYNTPGRYQMSKKERHARTRRKGFIAIACVSLVACLGAGTLLTNLVLGNLPAFVSIADASTKTKQSVFGTTEDDAKKLEEAGYSSKTLTGNAEKFTRAFLTFGKDTVKSGEWKSSWESYVDPEYVEVMSVENLIRLRDTDNWKSMFDAHEYYIGNVESCDSIQWDFTTLDGTKVPYCLITVTETRPECDFYAINSPGIVLDRFKSTYRIAFTPEGKICTMKRTKAELVNRDIDKTATKEDQAATSKMIGNLQKEQQQIEQKEAAEEAAKQKAEEEAKRKAEEEAKKKAEEEAKKKAEEEKKKPENTNTGGDGNENTNTGGGGNENSGGGGGNENSGGGGGNENSGGGGNANAQ